MYFISRFIWDIFEKSSYHMFLSMNNIIPVSLALIETCPGNPICNGHGFCPEGRKICVCLHGFTGYGCENSPEPMDEKVKALKERDGSNLIHKVSIIF